MMIDLIELNVIKTEEMLIDFRRNRPTLDSVTIKDCNVERVDNSKYLGVHIDAKLIGLSLLTLS